MTTDGDFNRFGDGCVASPLVLACPYDLPTQLPECHHCR